MSKLSPAYGNIVLKPIENEQETFGNIIIPDLGKERPEMAEVVATNKIYNWNTGEYVNSQFEIGDKVLIPKLGGIKITVEGEDYFICKEGDILSKVN